ncbi:hypothetical protein Cal7507_1153 [Calothrix sp. PCC 7507]|nr:hypothetical protein Cal7507_1153 [Calothrix sp. PCC 7507]
MPSARISNLATHLLLKAIALKDKRLLTSIGYAA